MNYAKEKAEIDFAYKVRRAMTESAESLPADTLNKLAKARELALSRQKPEGGAAVLALSGALAGNTGRSITQRPWFRKLAFSLPLIVLAVGLYGIYEHEQQQQINDLAEIDAAVLVDELPPDAYVDNGFNAYLNKDNKPAEQKTEE